VSQLSINFNWDKAASDAIIKNSCGISEAMAFDVFRISVEAPSKNGSNLDIVPMGSVEVLGRDKLLPVMNDRVALAIKGYLKQVSPEVSSLDSV